MKLRLMRYARELDVDEVAKMVGVSKSTIEQIEGQNKEFSCISKIEELYEKIPIPEPLNLKDLVKKYNLTYRQITLDTGISFHSLKELEGGRQINFKKMRRIREYFKNLENRKH